MIDVRGRLRRWRQGGEGRLGAIFALAIAALVVYLLIKIVPVQVRKAQFSRDVEIETTRYVVNELSMDQLLVQLVKDAALQDIDVAEDDIVVNDTQTRVQVSVDFEIVMPMLWGDWVRSFHVEHEIPRL